MQDPISRIIDYAMLVLFVCVMLVLAWYIVPPLLDLISEYVLMY